MEEGVSNRNDGNMKKYDEEKEAECPDDTSPVDMEKGVNDRNDEEKET